MKPQLLFVYNADNNLFSKITDFAHKIISPSTYKCHLCALTYDNTSMKGEWKSFLESISAEVIFLYKDEFLVRYEQYRFFPAVFLLTGEHIEELVSTKEIESCASLNELKTMVLSKLV